MNQISRQDTHHQRPQRERAVVFEAQEADDGSVRHQYSWSWMDRKQNENAQGAEDKEQRIITRGEKKKIQEKETLTGPSWGGARMRYSVLICRTAEDREGGVDLEREERINEYLQRREQRAMKKGNGACNTNQSEYRWHNFISALARALSKPKMRVESNSQSQGAQITSQTQTPK
ncbi:hypothetical protein K438DRAFT_1787020 [Mycena galopus ATCC 62051]|nr:hypothetical protein K438DRAFT_1787020 [Mycena galopus ATCC 62051]